ncbi:MAG: PaaI family thioesterase [Proteobacteria bacterium]|nr:PaaI family thioesterase [Pseudomonadota bacterium]
MRELSGLQILERMLRGEIPAPSMAETLSFTLTEVSEGRAVFVGTTGPHLLNPMGAVHGGWCMTLIDSATGCAALTCLPTGVGYTTVETHTNMVRPILQNAGRVTCEARVLARGRQIITAEATVKDAAGRLLAHGGSTLMVLQPRG